MNFELATIKYNELNSIAGKASVALRAVNGVGSGAMGLTPDSVRATPEYKAAKMAFDTANYKAREFNSWYNKTFKKELAALRKIRRETYYKGA